MPAVEQRIANWKNGPGALFAKPGEDIQRRVVDLAMETDAVTEPQRRDLARDGVGRDRVAPGAADAVQSPATIAQTGESRDPRIHRFQGDPIGEAARPAAAEFQVADGVRSTLVPCAS